MICVFNLVWGSWTELISGWIVGVPLFPELLLLRLQDVGRMRFCSIFSCLKLCLVEGHCSFLFEITLIRLNCTFIMKGRPAGQVQGRGTRTVTAFVFVFLCRRYHISRLFTWAVCSCTLLKCCSYLVFYFWMSLCEAFTHFKLSKNAQKHPKYANCEESENTYLHQDF